MAPPEEKKDLTTLVDLAKKEPLQVPQGADFMEMPKQEKLSDSDFGTLSEYAAANPDQIPQEEPVFAVAPPASESSPMESPVQEVAAEPALPAFEASSSDPAVLENPAFPTFDSAPDSSAVAMPSFEAAPVSEVSETVSVPEQELDPEPASVSEPVPEPEHNSEPAPSFHSMSGMTAAIAAPAAPIVLPDKPIVAPPVSADKVVHAKAAPAQPQEAISGIRSFGEKLAISHPKIEASPPFSVMATLRYSAEKEKFVKDVLSQEDYGIRFQDVAVQLKSGKLFIPKVSEFAAIHLAMKLREIVDDLEVGLASEIYKSKTLEETAGSDFENVLFEYETLDTHDEDVRDLAAEPKTEKELFTTHLNEVHGFKVVRILSALTVSKVVGAEVAEDQTGARLEMETEALAQELVTKAFKLGAHGVIGISFSLKSFEVQSSVGKKRAYRLWGNGTAVRVKALQDVNKDSPAI